MYLLYVFFFKQKTAYEMRISDWSSDVCSSDLAAIVTACLMGAQIRAALMPLVQAPSLVPLAVTLHILNEALLASISWQASVYWESYPDQVSRDRKSVV